MNSFRVLLLLLVVLVTFSCKYDLEKDSGEGSDTGKLKKTNTDAPLKVVDKIEKDTLTPITEVLVSTEDTVLEENLLKNSDKIEKTTPSEPVFVEEVDIADLDLSGKYVVTTTASQAEIAANFRKLGDNRYMFTLTTGNAEGTCTGELQGIIVIRESKKASYKEDLMGVCEVTFDFTDGANGSLLIIEGECDVHGENCSFAGEYVKQ